MASAPLNQTSEATEQRFRRLEARWIAETGHLSSYTAIVRHPAFREILEMGEAAIPLMLSDLADRPGEGQRKELEIRIANLSNTGYELTSPSVPQYNRVAWAQGGQGLTAIPSLILRCVDQLGPAPRADV